MYGKVVVNVVSPVQVVVVTVSVGGTLITTVFVPPDTYGKVVVNVVFPVQVVVVKVSAGSTGVFGKLMTTVLVSWP